MIVWLIWGNILNFNRFLIINHLIREMWKTTFMLDGFVENLVILLSYFVIFHFKKLSESVITNSIPLSPWQFKKLGGDLSWFPKITANLCKDLFWLKPIVNSFKLVFRFNYLWIGHMNSFLNSDCNEFFSLILEMGNIR